MTALIDSLLGSNTSRESLRAAGASSSEGEAFARLLGELEQPDPLGSSSTALVAAPQPAPRRTPEAPAPGGAVDEALREPGRLPPGAPAGAIETLGLSAAHAGASDVAPAMQLLREGLVPSDPERTLLPAPPALAPMVRPHSEGQELSVQTAPEAVAQTRAEGAKAPILLADSALAVPAAAVEMAQTVQPETSALLRDRNAARRESLASRPAVARPQGGAPTEPLFAAARPALDPAAATPASAAMADPTPRAIREKLEAAREMAHVERAAAGDLRTRTISERPETTRGADQIERAAAPTNRGTSAQQPNLSFVPGEGLVATTAVDPGRPVASPLVEQATAGRAEDVVPPRVEWLASRGGGSARIVLHPAELGEVEISVRVRGSAVDVVIQAREPAAQIALADVRDQLAESLVARDLRIGSLEIRMAELRGDLADSGSSSTQDRASGHANPDAEDSTARSEDGSQARSDARSEMPAEATTDEQNLDPAIPKPQARLDLHV